jgi:hypothetical protein
LRIGQPRRLRIDRRGVVLAQLGDRVGIAAMNGAEQFFGLTL